MAFLSTPVEKRLETRKEGGGYKSDRRYTVNLSKIR